MYKKSDQIINNDKPKYYSSINDINNKIINTSYKDDLYEKP